MLTTGFDTASSIALLAISAIAQRGPNGQAINHAQIIILPVSLIGYAWLIVVPVYCRNVVCRFLRFGLDALRLCIPFEVYT
jgi:hypothetical protein